MISENIKNNINSFLGVTSASPRSTDIPLLGIENNQFSMYIINHIFNDEKNFWSYFKRIKYK